CRDLTIPYEGSVLLLFYLLLLALLFNMYCSSTRGKKAPGTEGFTSPPFFAILKGKGQRPPGRRGDGANDTM
ncbi:hypothetical protein, partial [uncultured Subdoligranulum sp.]|uniref:hypothetical protein n=1 Tax=uncultured Subdoligranulum sp. TaxID=512298 RepID=UPI0025F74515